MTATVFFNAANELATLSNTFKVNGVATDPGAATLTVTSPSNVVTSYTWPTPATLTRTGTGAFTKDVASNEAGTWQYQWDGTTTAADDTFGTWEVFETALGHLYATVDALKSRLNITGTSNDFELHAACFAASRAIEQECERTFWRTASTEVRTFEPADYYWVKLPVFNDLVSVTTLKTDAEGDGVFETTWTTADYQLLPYNTAAGPESRPYTKIKCVGSRIFPVPIAAPLRGDRVQITGVFGWPAVPWAIKQAALILAADTYKLKDAPFGVASFGDFAMRVGNNPRTMSFLAPYKRSVLKVA